jgi:hypothetical protein
MSQSAPDIVLLARALTSGNVKYVVIGGMAMTLHGSNHVTEDCDLAVSSDPNEVDLLVEALRPFNPRPLRSIGPKFEWDRYAIAGPFTRLMTDAGGIDLMTHVIGVDSFAGLFERSVLFDLDGVPLRVASIDDLQRMKSVAPRDRDLAHLRELEALKKLQADMKPK